MVCFVVMGLFVAFIQQRLIMIPENSWYIARSEYPRCLNSYEECEAFARQWHQERPLSRYSSIINRHHCERKAMFYNAWYGNDLQRKLLRGITLVPARKLKAD